MMTIRSSILALLISTLLFSAQAQSPQLDSIDRLIDNSKIDTTRINLLLKKAELLSSINLDSSISLYKQIFEQTNNVNYRKGKLVSLRYLAIIYAKKGDSINAEKNLTQLKQLVKPSKDSAEIGEMYGSFGHVYSIQARYDEAIPLLLKAINILERHSTSHSLLDYYNQLGNSYWLKGNFPLALEYHQAKLKLAEKESNIRAQAVSLVNIAGIQTSMRDFLRAEQSYKEVIEIAKKNDFTDVEVYAYSNLSTLAMNKKEHENAYEFAIKAAELGSTLGDQIIQAANFSKAANGLAALSRFVEAEKYAQQAIDIANTMDQQFISSQAYSSMGSVLLFQKKYKKAIPYFEKALSEVNLNDFSEHTSSLFNQLSECYEKTGKPEKALEAIRKHNMVKDSVRNRENIQKATEQNMNFEFDKKQTLAKAAQDVKDAEAERTKNQQYFGIILLGLVLLTVGAIAFLQYRSNKQKQKANLLLQDQKQKVEATLSELKTTQGQLIQSEKMASLGELTAGIAHEIQNPLNFVNNFSEVNNELIDEIEEERGKKQEVRDEGLITEILTDIKQNLEKINHHGKRADGIVKGMLQHSRSSRGKKEPTDINTLTDEYLRLAYHGLRAKDKTFNAQLVTDFDASIKTVNIIPQDVGRVILNLLTNAFYAVNEKKREQIEGYEPTVSISTKKDKHGVEIKVTDNGNGMPDAVKDKIFQPFFTTKPTGQGTGLGLSMSYDIITKGHGGELKVKTKKGEGTTFTVIVPEK